MPLTDPSDAEALIELGVQLCLAGRLKEALLIFDKVLVTDPDNIHALNNRGIILRTINRPKEALESYDRALAIQPDFAEAWNNRAKTLKLLSKLDDALESCNRALALNPHLVDALQNRGGIFQALGDLEKALADYDRTLAFDPTYAEALNNRGTVLHGLKRYDDAVSSFNKAVAINPNYAEALNNCGVTLSLQDRPYDALEKYESALALSPDYVEALLNRGNVLYDLNRFQDARLSYEKLLSVQPDNNLALNGLANVVLNLCDWRSTHEVAQTLVEQLRHEGSLISPLITIGYFSQPELQLKCALGVMRGLLPQKAVILPHRTFGRDSKIRLAYLSADFFNHATTHLLAELIERHDRSRFEIFGISFGPNDGSFQRVRMEQAFDEFIDVRAEKAEDIAMGIAKRRVDIAIDLKGLTRGGRPEILSYRPAPIQVSYLGYPATMGADFIDYIIGDPIVSPISEQRYFSEKIANLPDCYQANDNARAVAGRTPSREEVGLPTKGFVFCCFNNCWKITEHVFDIWMRLLIQIEGSVLWLFETNETATANLRAAATARDVDANRLIFARRMAHADHLARYRLADLFLDTSPYNAHTTASDALWTGLPVLTCRGETFSGRVGASLLYAVGLPELVVEGWKEYENLALQLARSPARLHTLAERLASNRNTKPLFDSDRFRRNIEAAYVQMHEISLRGESPRSFSV